jgi:hypothetical protein
MDLVDLLEWPHRADVPGMLFRRLISRHALVGIDRMTRAEQVLWLVFELCGEVSNGGLDQFFSNSSGDRARLVPGALRELGPWRTRSPSSPVASRWSASSATISWPPSARRRGRR